MKTSEINGGKVRNPVARDMRQRSKVMGDRRQRRSKDARKSWRKDWE